MNAATSNVLNMFYECGLRLEGREFPNNLILPSKEDLYDLNGTEYDTWNEENKIRIIKSYVSNETQFQISNWRFFFPNITVSKDEEDILTNVFEPMTFVLKNKIIFINQYTLSFKNMVEKLLELSLNNKKLMNVFSKEFQIKAVFHNKNQLIKEFKSEILNLFKNKLNNSGFKEKFEVELPKLIMKELK